MSVGRVICTFIPFLMTIGSAICIILVFLGNTTTNSKISHQFYFASVNLADFTYASKLNTADWYTIGLWNYCSGPSSNALNDPTYCSPRKAFYHFDPITAFNLEGTSYTGLASDSWTAGLEEYQKASKWMWILYIVAAAGLGCTLILSLFACCSRVGSAFTSLAAFIAAVFFIAGSAVATAVFVVLEGYVKKKLSGYGVTSSLGHGMFVTMWIGAALALVAFLSWIWTCCCCGGSSSGDKSERTYVRVPPMAQRGAWFRRRDGAVVPANGPVVADQGYRV